MLNKLISSAVAFMLVLQTLSPSLVHANELYLEQPHEIDEHSPGEFEEDYYYAGQAEEIDDEEIIDDDYIKEESNEESAPVIHENTEIEIKSLQGLSPQGITTSAANLRREVGVSSTLIRNLPSGTSITILGSSTSGNRLRVRTGNDIGWIDASFAEPLSFILPVAGAVVTCPWNGYPNHSGIDFQNLSNSTAPILAAASGVVESVVRSNIGYGNHIVIRHNINGRTYYTLYAHMSNLDVSVGQQVSQGQKIGNKGLTGNTTGPHLHFEIRRDHNTQGNAVNPELYLRNLTHLRAC